MSCSYNYNNNDNNNSYHINNDMIIMVVNISDNNISLRE